MHFEYSLCFFLQKNTKSFYFEHPHLRDLDWGWAFQGVSGVGHSRETLKLGTPGVSGLGTPGVSKGQSGRESLGLGTPGVSRSRPGEEKSSGREKELS